MFDQGELSATTDSEGTFLVGTDDNDLYQCLVNRPIVANVPVGAVDSTSGTVRDAYQMILPPLEDLGGSTTVVVSPFTSLLSEAILKGKADSNLNEELLFEEGCESIGNQVANKISLRLNELAANIEDSFNIPLSVLLSDFVADPYGGIVNIPTAQNIATYFPHIKQINEIISSDLSNKFAKDINTNISLHNESLDEIFSGEYFSQLPLNFQSRYVTLQNDAGWFQIERINAEKGFLSDSGILYREHCDQSNNPDFLAYCNVDESLDISLENIANTSTNYFRESSFINNSITFNETINQGSIQVIARDARSWRNNSENWFQINNRNRECQTDNEITFRNNEGVEYQYSSYSQGYSTADCSLVRHYYYPRLLLSSFNETGQSIQLSYYIPDIIRSGIIKDAPYEFIKQQLTLDPTNVINEISALPSKFEDIQSIRRMFNVDEYVLFEFYETSDLTHQFEFGTFPRNDFFNTRLCTDSCINLVSYYGQDARDQMFNLLKNESSWASAAGQESPQSKVLGRLSSPYIEISDYDESNNERNFDVYPVYDQNNKVLNLSLTGGEIDLENIKTFLSEGIGNTPLDASIYINPDDSVSGTLPIKLSLYQGGDNSVDDNEDYMTIEFNLEVSPAEEGLSFSLLEGEEILAKYVDGSTTISRTIINQDYDNIIISDGILNKPSSLNIKILNLLSRISDAINGLEEFFTDGGIYFFQVNLGSDFSIIDYYRNTVDVIEGTFSTKSTPSSGIFVRDISVDEGQTKPLCFFRQNNGNKPETSFNISFVERERPGRGGVAEDFELSTNIVNFAEGQTESCIDFTANIDAAFDWVHEIVLDLSVPTNDQYIARNQVKIRIIDALGRTNRISGSQNIF